MTIYSLDLRERALALYIVEKLSIRKIAERLLINKSTVNEWLKLYREQGNVKPKRVGSTRKSQLEDYKEEVKKMVAEYPDYTLAEYCEYCLEKMGVGLSESAMCRFLQKENLTRKKKTLKASQAGTEANQEARLDYWEKIRDVKSEDLVFIDEMAILLGIMREYGRSLIGTRLYDKKPFYRGERITVVGAITQEKVIAFDIIGKSMKGEDFKKFVKEHLVPELWDGAVVVMDRLRAHQVEGIKEMVEEVGAKVIYLSGYSPDFNPIEHLWWELKAFIRRFVPKSKIVVEALLRMAVKYLISSVHLRNYFAHCCYCTS